MVEQSGNDNVSHEDLIESRIREKSSTNPFAHSSNIIVSVPETVDIKLVDASVLSDYEVWSLSTSILSSFVVGFFVAYLQEDKEEVKSIFGIVALLFLLLLAISGIMAFSKRSSLSKKTKKVRFAVGEQVEERREV